MSKDSRVNELLEQALETGCSLQEVCRDCPELLPAVEVAWKRFNAVQAQLDDLFPSSAAERTSIVATINGTDDKLPNIVDYEIIGVLGRGGMGVVYQARHLKLNRTVALKMLLSGNYAASVELERFQREAEAVAGLNNSNIVQIHDVGEFEGRPYFTMEYVVGGSLAEALAGIPQAARQAAENTAILADAVEVAHQSGVIHRDLKPSNILVTADGTLKITDFGLARRVANGPELTKSGARVGTPSYMAPEQALGKQSSIGPAVDIYALGTILYEMLTGRPPFRAETASETERQVISEEPVLPTQLNAKVPKDLETICLKCLRKDPCKRYETAKQLAEDLQRFLHGEPVVARPVGRLERIGRWIQRNPTTTALIVTAILLCMLTLAATWREWELSLKQKAELGKWADRLAFMSKLQQESRFAEARAVLQEAHTDNPDLQLQMDQARSRLNLVEQLDIVRLSRDMKKDGGGIDYAESSQRYETIFRESGLGCYQDDPEQVADRLHESPIRRALIASLDDWATCAEKKERDWVLRVARHMDPDPWRDQIRDLDGWAKKETFPALATAANIPSQPVTIMVAFSTRWRRLGGDPTAFLEKVQRQFPNDFWVNFELCHLYEGSDPAKAIGYARAALAVRSDSPMMHYKLGSCHANLKQYDEAFYHYRRAIELDPAFLLARINLGSALADQGQFTEAIDHWRKVLAVAPGRYEVRRALCGNMIRLGKAKEARQEWYQLLQNRQTNFEDWDGYAELCLFLGDKEEYQRVCTYLLAQFAATNDARVFERLGRTCLLTPSSTEQMQSAASLIDRALASDKAVYPAWIYDYFQFAKALAEYRQSRFENAVAIVRGKASDVLGPAPKLVLAMALFRQGKPVEARTTLDSAIKSFDWRMENALLREIWIYHILRREAETLIRSK